VEVSHVRKRLTASLERARRDAQQRRERTAEAQRAYDVFLADIAVPISRMLVSALKADGYMFTIATPGGGVRLTSDKTRDDYIDIALDSTSDPPQVVGHINYTRGSRTISDERPIKAGELPSAITEEEFLDFLLSALDPWLAR
jgi:hypothetical protein